MFKKILPYLIGFVLGTFFGQSVKDKITQWMPSKDTNPDGSN